MGTQALLQGWARMGVSAGGRGVGVCASADTGRGVADANELVVLASTDVGSGVRMRVAHGGGVWVKHIGKGVAFDTRCGSGVVAVMVMVVAVVVVVVEPVCVART